MPHKEGFILAEIDLDYLKSVRKQPPCLAIAGPSFTTISYSDNKIRHLRKLKEKEQNNK